MKKNALVKRMNLSKTDLDDIEKKVRDVEKNTLGEIVVAVASESASYAVWELLASIATSAVLFLCLYNISPVIYEWLSSHIWGCRPYHLSLFFLASCSVCTVVMYFLYNVSFIDFAVIPEAAKSTAVTNRAMRYFAESGVYSTENSSGVLVFISYFEREVRIIADRGISGRISNDLWNLIADDLVNSLSKGKFKDGLMDAIERCGELLAEKYPIGENVVKKDELPNGLRILEDEKWV